MVTLNAKLNGIDDEKLVARVVEIWGFFWDQVLTYLEGVRSFVFAVNYPLPNQITGALTITNRHLIVDVVSNAEVSQANLSKSTE
jgi:HbrB-like